MPQIDSIYVIFVAALVVVGALLAVARKNGLRVIQLGGVSRQKRDPLDQAEGALTEVVEELERAASAVLARIDERRADVERLLRAVDERLAALAAAETRLTRQDLPPPAPAAQPTEPARRSACGVSQQAVASNKESSPILTQSAPLRAELPARTAIGADGAPRGMGIVPLRSSDPVANPPRSPLATDPRLQRVYALADSGSTPLTIAAQLNMMLGEVEVALSLREYR